LGRLILLRHAKSSWASAGLADHDRPLNARGRRAAAAVGEWLRREGYLPDLVLCSTARRTRETTELLGLDAELRTLSELYHAEPAAMAGVLRRAGDAECVLMVGHNPGIAAVAAGLVERPPAHPRFPDFPTAATLVADFTSGWADLRAGTGTVVGFIVPADLDPALAG
jgi:phosphohistidine phosphatase